MIEILLLIVGFLLLIKGADWLVDGSVSIARRFGVSDLVIGLTIVAMGTSAPELFVNLLSAFQGNTDIAIGNVVGSNIVNILLILGITAIIYPIAVQRSTTWKEIPFSLLAAILVGVTTADLLFDKSTVNIISRVDGIIYLLFFAIYLYYLFGIAGDNKKKHKPKFSVWQSIGLVIVGIVGLVIGGKFVVDGAVFIAKLFGMSEALIGLTIVAIGTSLPELVTSIVAATKKNTDIAIGNIVGSNIFNIFWILGITAIIHPLIFTETLLFDVIVVIFATLLLFAFMFVGKRHHLERWQGIVFVICYVVYIAVIILRELA